MIRQSLTAALAFALTSGAGIAASTDKAALIADTSQSTQKTARANVVTAGNIQPSTYVSPGSRHKVFINASQRQALRTAAVLARVDYEAFSLIETDAAGLSDLMAQGATLGDSYNLILLNSGVIDTTSPAGQQLAQQQPVLSNGKGMYLVQFAGPVQPEWYQNLANTGAQIVTAIQNSAYLVYGDSAALQRVTTLRAANSVQFVAPYLAFHRIDPDASSDAGGMLGVQLVADDATNGDTLSILRSFATGEVREDRYSHYVNVYFTARAGAVAALSQHADVVSIHADGESRKFDERQNRIISGFLSGNTPIAGDYLSWLAGKGFTQAQFDASGFIVSVVDSGIDNATTTPNHFALRRFGDLSQPGRVAFNRLVGTPNSGSTLQGKDGHGSLNSHIIGGYVPAGAPFNAAPHSDAQGYRYDLGVAPFVKVGSSVIFDPSSFTNPNVATIESLAYADGARISSNSWGNTANSAYTARAQTYDGLVRDAVSTTAGNQQMVIVFAAGNSGSAANTVREPGVAKNLITVGASEGVQAFGGADNCGIGDSGADSANDIISFSGRGPSSGGRKKPDIVAPGTHISGGVWQNTPPPATNTTGVAAPTFDGTGVCRGPVPSLYWPLAQQWYTASSGTSHSTPAVAGGTALVRQYFINQGASPPSPSMTKSFLMNSTRYLTGVSANDNLWSNNQGMGLMDLGRAFDGISRITRDELAADLFTASGQSRTFTGTVASASEPFRVTVGWTDAPGPTSGAPQLNDLDLTVTINGTSYRGNVFSGANSVAGGSKDSANNVESVFLPAGFPVGTQFAITVTAANIVADGVPVNASALDQDFSLVAYNAQAASFAVITADSLTLTAENALPPNNVPDPGETVSYGLGLKNVGTAATTSLVATLQNSGGVQAASAAQSYGALAGGGSAVVEPFSFKVDNTLACGSQITATWLLNDGVTNLGTVQQNLTLGVLQSALSENFDGVTAPALPAGWSTTSSSAAPAPWVTQTGTADTAPNAAFTNDPATAGESSLVSPSFLVSTPSAQLTFRGNYNTEANWDGGVLEIAIGGGAFQDILTAGGSFVSGGYNGTLGNFASCSATPNPLADRAAWTGNSGGYITSVVTLPASANGQNVQLRWRMGSDCSQAGVGWRVDTVQVLGSYLCSTAPADPLSSDLAINVTNQRTSVQEGQPVAYTITASNGGPDAVIGARVQVPAASGLSALSWTCTATGSASCQTASGTGSIDALVDIGIGSGDTAVFTFNATVQTAPEQTITVTGSISPPVGTIDPNPANNIASDSDPMVLFADGFDPPSP